MLDINPIPYPLVEPDSPFGKSNHPIPYAEIKHDGEVISNETLMTNRKDFFGLAINLGQEFSYSFPFRELPSRKFYRNQFIFARLPQYSMQCKLKKGTFSVLSFSIDAEFLRQNVSNSHFLSEFCKEPYDQSPVITPRPLAVSPELFHKVHELLYAKPREQSRDAFISKMFFEIFALVMDQLSSIYKEVEHIEAANETAKLKEAKKYLRAHLQDSVTLSLLADAVGVEPKTITRLFKKNLHMTAMHFLFHERMEQARTLLLESSKSIDQIAKAVGYTSNPHFTRAFKRKFGYSPLEIRQRDSAK